jgi:hypothetical protein
MRILRNNALTLVLMLLFLGTWIGQTATGLRKHNEEQREHGDAPVTLKQYVTSGHFWEATAENWESEFLQMAMFLILTACLFQKGSPESKDPDEPDAVDNDPELQRSRKNAPWAVRKGGIIMRLYSHSLSICFAIMFLISFALHAAAGARQYSDEQRQHGQPPVTMMQYMGTSQFWFESMQNWQSEFLSLAAMVYLSVYLRQKGSPESKPVATPHDESGDDEPVVRKGSKKNQKRELAAV